MRKGGTLYFMLSDHLGSTSLTTDASGNVISELRYTAWGEVRYNSGVTPTQYQYTGQMSYTESFGLMYYGARWLDVSLGRFAQADTIVPGGVQGMDRYAYANNDPVRYTDPTGHKICDYDCQIEYERADPAYKHYGEDISCWGPEQCWGVKPNTVVSRAFDGDTGAIVDAVIPTTAGVRVQGEFVPKEPLSILGFQIPWSVSVGGQVVFNRNDGDISMNLDIAPEIGPAFMPDPIPIGASATGGPLLGWFSSDAQQITTGDSTIVSITVAGGDAYSAAIITSPPGTPPDPKYGVKPVTIYAGKGVGGGYLSFGTGIARSFWEYSINISNLWR